jgi:hypothetical protein
MSRNSRQRTARSSRWSNSHRPVSTNLSGTLTVAAGPDTIKPGLLEHILYTADTTVLILYTNGITGLQSSCLTAPSTRFLNPIRFRALPSAQAQKPHGCCEAPIRRGDVFRFSRTLDDRGPPIGAAILVFQGNLDHFGPEKRHLHQK